MSYFEPTGITQANSDQWVKLNFEGSAACFCSVSRVANEMSHGRKSHLNTN
jgi:hypothetical protein